MLGSENGVPILSAARKEIAVALALAMEWKDI